MFDPEAFGAAMGDLIRAAVEPLEKRIDELQASSKSIPDVGALVAAEVEKHMALLPVPKDGKDAAPIDQEEIVKQVLAKIPTPANGRDGKDGKDGVGLKGADGLGLAGAMIDREGALQITMTNGEVKNLGPVVGKDGNDGKNGVDGVSLDSFDMEYLPESHEITIKATAAGRTKELRYPAGGIRPAGYWREGTRAKAGEAWVNDGSLWIAVKDCQSKPGLNDEGWIIAARKGRDGENGRAPKPADTAPIQLGK